MGDGDCSIPDNALPESRAVKDPLSYTVGIMQTCDFRVSRCRPHKGMHRQALHRIDVEKRLCDCRRQVAAGYFHSNPCQTGQTVHSRRKGVRQAAARDASVMDVQHQEERACESSAQRQGKPTGLQHVSRDRKTRPFALSAHLLAAQIRQVTLLPSFRRASPPPAMPRGHGILRHPHAKGAGPVHGNWRFAWDSAARGWSSRRFCRSQTAAPCARDSQDASTFMQFVQYPLQFMQYKQFTPLQFMQFGLF